MTFALADQTHVLWLENCDLSRRLAGSEAEVQRLKAENSRLTAALEDAMEFNTYATAGWGNAMARVARLEPLVRGLQAMVRRYLRRRT